MTMRETIFDALANSEDLNELGITTDSLFHNWTMEQRPVDGAPFAILRWGRVRKQWGVVEYPVPLTIWVHYPLELSNDHSKLVDILRVCDQVLSEIEGCGGVGFVQPTEWSEDHHDVGFQTISKNAQYNVLAQRKDS